jgi:hypothetical protein
LHDDGSMTLEVLHEGEVVAILLSAAEVARLQVFLCEARQ